MRRFFAFVVDHPKPILGVFLVITLLMGSFLFRLRIDTDIRRMVGKDQAVIAELDEIVDEFGAQTYLLITLKADDVFDPATLAFLQRVADEVEGLPGVIEVRHPLNLEIIQGSEWGIEIRPVVASLPTTGEEIEAFRQSLLANAHGRQLVSADGRGALIIAKLDPDILGTKGEWELARRVEDLLAREKDYELYANGDIVVNYYANTYILNDVARMLPLAALVIFTILYLCFRSHWGIIIPLLTVLVSLIWCLGLIVLLGYPLTMVSTIIPVILVSMASANGIHILNRYREELALGGDLRDCIIQTMLHLTSPITMSALTTVAGFLTLLTSFVPPIREFGCFTAFGIFIGLLFSLVGLPAVITCLGIQETARGNQEGRLSRALGSLAALVNNHHQKIIWGTGLVFVAFLFGIPKLTVEANFVEYFRQDSPIVRAIRELEELFGGFSQLALVVDTGEEDGLKEPENLRLMQSLEDYMEGRKEISRTSSLVGLVKEINQAFHDGDESHYRIPDTREEIAQQLLLFTMSGGSGIDSLASYDFQRGLITGALANLTTKQTSQVVTDLEEYAKGQLAAAGLKGRVAGLPKITVVLMEQFVRGQITSLFWAITTVTLIVVLIMKSWLLGMITALPLTVTIGIVFGVMGYFGIPLDFATTMIASICFGMGIDYAIHFVSRYIQERAGGLDHKGAVNITIKSTGMGIFFNALTLILGFGILVLSNFNPLIMFGLLIALTMVISCTATLVLVPTVLGRISPARMGAILQQQSILKE
ncbi:MAG: RND family transporter [Firmicutes bacterium]|nr:RND family transporter [Bacillota bacterium]